MTTPYPGQQPQQPDGQQPPPYGQQLQPPYGQQPYGQQPPPPPYGQQPPPPYGYPAPPPPPQKSNAGKIIGFGCGGIVLLALVLFACGAVVTGASKSSAKKDTPITVPSAPGASAPNAAPMQPAPGTSEAPAGTADKNADVVLTASPTAFRPSVLAQGSDYTSVRVTIVNNAAKQVDVNVFYFEVTAEDGTRKQIELAASEDQIDTVKLAKGEKATGTITVKGKITAKTVTFRNGFVGKTYTAPVK
ncbi:DUF4352 domain-containing protein [Streptomyces sp. NPDC004126]|uniref:DUF4352 domain-containing protein n=1 Tax=Streptomyces sp. NPDC004126 TaxID=3390695 RepID=UPI003D03A49C